MEEVDSYLLIEPLCGRYFYFQTDDDDKTKADKFFGFSITTPFPEIHFQIHFHQTLTSAFWGKLSPDAPYTQIMHFYLKK